MVDSKAWKSTILHKLVAFISMKCFYIVDHFYALLSKQYY